MALFLYTVWFRDPVAEPSGADPEWLAHRRSGRADSLRFHESEAEPMAGPLENPEFLPFVRAGAHPTDEELGW